MALIAGDFAPRMSLRVGFRLPSGRGRERA